MIEKDYYLLHLDDKLNPQIEKLSFKGERVELEDLLRRIVERSDLEIFDNFDGLISFVSQRIGREILRLNQIDFNIRKTDQNTLKPFNEKYTGWTFLPKKN